ncbi:MAG: glycerol kinase GlpK [Candidatus Omnitrophota bacterium]
MKYILSIDQGTTGSRAYIFDKSGRIVSGAYKEFRQIYPREGWVEHDAEEIWRSVEFVVKQALAAKKIKASDIAAIGITNQRETTVLWDRKTGKPLHNAIVWQCRRTAPICEDLKKKGYSGLFRRKTGLIIDPYFSGTKIKWLLSNLSQSHTSRSDTSPCVGTMDTWLIWKLTGGKTHATDYTNASRTLIFNIRQKKWDGQLLKILGIPKAILPEVKPSSSIFGYTAKGACGLPAGIPISGVAGDQQAALFGQGCFSEGEMKNTYGTGCFLVLNTGKKFILSNKGLLTTLACDTRGLPCYAQEGSIFIAGAAIQWLRDELKIIGESRESEKRAMECVDTGGVYFVPAFVGLGAPYWDPRARGTITGITRGTQRRHIIRAALEAIAYEVKDVADIMEKETGNRLKSLKVDGGACGNSFLMQFQADILGIKIIRPKITETTAKGAAMLAGLAVGFWKSPAELRHTLAAGKIFSPRMKAGQRQALYSGWLAAVRKARAS